MSLSTGIPLGTITSQEEIYLEGAPYIYFQDYSASLLNNPDADGYYWGLSGTSTYPVFNLGCISDVSLGENVTMNDIRCDTDGVRDTVQKRDYIEFTFTLRSMFPWAVIAKILNLSTPINNAPSSKMGIGSINNSQRWHVYAPKVYDEDVGDFVTINLHKAKFVDSWSIAMASGDGWNISGLRIRAFSDDTKPAGQKFGVITRTDASVVV